MTATTLHYDAIIGGLSVRTDRQFETLDPSTGKVLATVASCSADDVDAAVGAARAAQAGWSATPPAERGRTLRTLAGLIRRDAEVLSLTESWDTGKPLSQAQADVENAARYFEYYGSLVEGLEGATIPVAGSVHAFTLREPLGVTGHIVPWNYPIQISARTTAPALAAGNCCVLKPAEEAPLGALRLAELGLEAGLSPGVLNVVPGDGPVTGAALAGHTGINHLSFTGSVPTGREVAAKAGRNLVSVTLELGGKSPNIVFPDADPPRAVPTIVRSILQNAGQTCSAGSRLVVHRDVHDTVVAQVASAFRGLSMGPGPEDPDLGPLISAKQLERVTGMLADLPEPARVVVGYPVHRTADDSIATAEGGFFFPPTLVDHVPVDSVLAQQEVFGPVLSVISFDDEEQAVAIANGTPFGLVAAVWTADVGRAHRLARSLHAGQVFVNTYGAGGGVELPFGGIGESGFGREKGAEALVAYTTTKTVAIDYGGQE